MMTPEGREKAKIKQFLDSIGAHHFWPVQTGMGAATLDCLACIDGVFAGIEVKALGGLFTRRQRITMKKIEDAGGLVFGGTADQVIRGIECWRRSTVGTQIRLTLMHRVVSTAQTAKPSR